MESNKFSGFNSMRIFDVSCHRFSGILPSNYFGNWSAMIDYSVIDLSNNRFRGRIPDSIGDLRYLITLNCSRNSFDSLIPLSMGSLTELEFLDLSANKLSGRIPEELVNLYNQLSGLIP
ncbi:LRR domain containing protein [Parasponia andersonii]|uniref:LRR domain containing protein n=1 Tax=Parasponia andersonii TaxID=3476 RepID=A0A2P5C5U8_PARAD|nr:LRR domain containing protein [Parasponia andersonii]